jgi:hypothetical protein
MKMQKIKIKNKKKFKLWQIQQVANKKLVELVQLAIDNHYEKIKEARKASKARIIRGLSSL